MNIEREEDALEKVLRHVEEDDETNNYNRRENNAKLWDMYDNKYKRIQ